MKVPVNEKAVAIAKDVLKQLKTLQLEQGVYMDGEVPLTNECENAPADADLLQKHCQVCLLGASLLSMIRLYDGVTMTDLTREVIDDETSICLGPNEICRQLGDVFTTEQQDLIECAFEKSSCLASETADDRRYLADAAADFGNSFKGARARAAAVMKNIIANRGYFVPPGTTIEDVCRDVLAAAAD